MTFRAPLRDLALALKTAGHPALVAHGFPELDEDTVTAVLEAAGAGPLVATGRGALRLTQVQPAGKKSMPGAAFLCGHRLQVGERLGAGS